MAMPRDGASLPGLKRMFGEKFLTDEASLICATYDSSSCEGTLPLGVLRPTETDDVFRLIRFCARRGISVVARGGATGRTGGSVPIAIGHQPSGMSSRKDGILEEKQVSPGSEGISVIIDFTSMNKVLRIDPLNRTATVQPGVVVGDLQREVAKWNLFYPPDPASAEFCTIGGNLAENAGGLRALKYGVTRDYVLAAEVVTGEPKVLRLGSYAHKSVAGYDLLRLLVGSEGTLALFTEVTLRLLPLPEAVGTVCAFFKRPTTALSASVRLHCEVLPRALEFIDPVCVEAVFKKRKRKPAWFPSEKVSLLLVEFDGSTSSVRSDVRTAASFLRRTATAVAVAYSQKRREEFWSVRRDISSALYNIGASKTSEDVAVPLGRLADMYRAVKALGKRYGLITAVYGHCGDGNLHINLIPRRGEVKSSAVKELLSVALEVGGTITGEHGIGLTKLRFLPMELDEETLGVMRRIKRIFDPHNILNPGKAIL